MHHLMIGYGYSAYYLARHLLAKGKTVSAVSRHLDPAYQLPGLEHIKQDILTPLHWTHSNTILYYFIPPPSSGQHDTLLQQFLQSNRLNSTKVVYFSSSGVYGSQQGSWTSENAPCHLQFERQYRRLDAECQWQQYAKEQSISCVILRCAGIYGPHRLPLDAARLQTPLINPKEAPYSNLIFVDDLAKIAASLTPSMDGIYNVADGAPELMGSLQQEVADALQLPRAPYESFESIWATASPMKREFMSSSKRLDISALQQALPQLTFTPRKDAVRQSNVRPQQPLQQPPQGLV